MSETQDDHSSEHSYTHISANELTLEEAIEQLEETIETIEEGNIGLLRAKSLHERGEELLGFIESRVALEQGNVTRENPQDLSEVTSSDTIDISESENTTPQNNNADRSFSAKEDYS